MGRKSKAADRAYYVKWRAKSPKRLEYERQWREKNKARLKAWAVARNLLVNFGMTPKHYEELLAAQGGVCAICDRADEMGRALAVDHEHADGYGALDDAAKRTLVRGLLCTKCNTAIGLFRESHELIAKAAAYVERRRG